ncbi:hypothetical protein CKA32_004780 [Geitlerinema sp. FC II]|nr:hypothetical protein [Geitlerinema sp. CS-897]PPT07657.1 hypothetical protein CKA32_004780 [Geitlerinema sp. FC II]
MLMTIFHKFKKYLIFWILAAIALSIVLLYPTRQKSAAIEKTELRDKINSVDFMSISENKAQQEGINLDLEFEEDASDFLILPIPPQESEFIYPSSLSLRVRLTNNTSKPICPDWSTLVPELISPDGKALPLQGQITEPNCSEENFCPLLESGSSTSFWMQIVLSWKNDRVQLEIPQSHASFQPIELGTYQIRLTYRSSGATTLCLDPYFHDPTEALSIRKIDETGIGLDSTNLLPIHIVEPISRDGNVVELDGVKFETIIPETTWKIPNRTSEMRFPVKLGLRINNQKQQIVRFTQYDTLSPQMVDPNGQILQLKGSRNRSSPPTVSDCPLLHPEKSVTFVLDGELSWQNNKLQLRWSDGFGGIWFFDDLKPSTYTIRIDYAASTKPLSMYDLKIGTFRPVTQLWRSALNTNFIKIRLTQTN